MGNPWESCHSWETISAIHASTFAEKVHLLFYLLQLGSKAELMGKETHVWQWATDLVINQGTTAQEALVLHVFFKNQRIFK